MSVWFFTITKPRTRHCYHVVFKAHVINHMREKLCKTKKEGACRGREGREKIRRIFLHPLEKNVYTI